MELNIQNTKMELIRWLTTLEDNSIIQKLLDLRNETTSDWWDEISEQERQSIEAGIDDVKNGRVNSNDEAKKIYGKWL